MTASPRSQPDVDQEHLRVLSVLYLVYGGLAAALGLFALVFVAAGLVLGSGAAAGLASPEEQVAVAFVSCLLVAVGSGVFLVCGVIAAFRFLVGIALRRHRYYVLCLVAAGVSCFEIPLGAALGVATLIVLLRPSVERLFNAPAPAPS